jgi:hypothetical protein
VVGIKKFFDDWKNIFRVNRDCTFFSYHNLLTFLHEYKPKKALKASEVYSSKAVPKPKKLTDWQFLKIILY